MAQRSTAAAVVFDYHERTKHHFERYARGPETIDWEAQPDGFRRFDGAPLVRLPLSSHRQGPGYASLFAGTRPEFRPWDAGSLSRLLQFSMALAAWKQYGETRWSLRCNPSSGNLHPTETYLILTGIEGFEDGLYHYRVDAHALELRCRYPEGLAAGGPQVFLAFSSIPWREAWKYGERAYRYCQLDLGHALAALAYSATTLGCLALPLPQAGTDALACLLGLDRSAEYHPDEPEHPDLLVRLAPGGELPEVDLPGLLEASASGLWHGRANRLDRRHYYDWPIIDQVAGAARRPPGECEDRESANWPPPLPPAGHELSRGSARALFQQRRSAQAYDPSGSIAAEDFFRLLDRLLPRDGIPPWSAQAWPSRLCLALFVHRVTDLAPGLYLLARRTQDLDRLQRRLRGDLLWEPVDTAPAHLPLSCLARAGATKTAMHLACHQDIAGDGCFSLSMLASFDAALEQAPWRYDQLHWEAGMLGHSLYLEAEAIGLRGTGIGCFFDDGVHQMLGVQGRELQALYHFTVGLPLTDPRLATLPPYPPRDD